MKALDALVFDQVCDFFEPFKHITVSCSGGVDSVVLSHILSQIAKTEKKFHLSILHFNFGLRGKESERDEKFVQKFAVEQDLPLLLRKISSQERDSRSIKNIQAWARALRRETFQELGRSGHLIALAHHQDDLAENILMRIARGAGPGQLLGMKTWTPPLWRPFLSVSKETLEDWASRHNLPHVHDSSNDKMIYSRNVIRNLILPELEKLYPGARARIARCGRDIHSFVEYSRSHREGAKDKSLNRRPIMDRKDLKALPSGVSYDILSRSVGFVKGGLTHKVLEQAITHSLANTPTKLHITLPRHQGTLLSEQGAIYFEKKTTQRKKPRSQQHLSTILRERKAAILGVQSTITFVPGREQPLSSHNLSVKNVSTATRRFLLKNGENAKKSIGSNSSPCELAEEKLLQGVLVFFNDKLYQANTRETLMEVSTPDFRCRIW